MRKKYLFLTLIILCALLITGVLIVNINKKITINHPFVSNQSEVKFEVKSGDDLYSVVDALSSAGYIKNKKIVLDYIRSNKPSTKVVPGNYNFSNSVSLSKTIYYLNKGILDNEPVKVTIPEGYNIESIAQLLEDKGIIKKADFLKSCREYKLPEYIKNDSKRKYALEGYLFPDTYEFYKGTSGKAVIDDMTAAFKSAFDDVAKKTGKTISNEDMDKYVTVASILEKEVKIQADRGNAASVFYNRLSIGMKLQSCATVLYALGYYKDTVNFNDIKVDSTYNTYLYSGLPEGPISCPGRACIEAAVSPSKTNYLYFRFKSDGITHFYTNFNDFNNPNM
jgi:UPF0755 protein